MEDVDKHLWQKWELDFSDERDRWMKKLTSKAKKLEKKAFEKLNLPQFGLVDAATSGWKGEEDQEEAQDDDDDLEDTDLDEEEEAHDADGAVVQERRRRRRKKGLFERALSSFDDRMIPKTNEKRQKIGFLKARVKSIVCDFETKLYFEIAVEDEKFVSPVAFREGDRAFMFEIGGRYPITDITGQYTIHVYKNSIISDALIGTVNIPFRSIPWRGCPETSVYTIFRNEESTGVEITLTHELALDGNPKVIWPFYFINTAYPNAKSSKPKQADVLDSVKTLNALSESIKELRRNSQRIEAVAEKIVDSFFWQMIFYMRERPIISVALVLLLSWCPNWMLPFILYIMLVYVCIFSMRQGNQTIEVVNEDESTVKINKVIKQIHQVSRVLKKVAVLFEKSLNAWNFADPVATSCLLGVVFFLVVVPAASAIHFCELLGINFIVLAVLIGIVLPLPDPAKSNANPLACLLNRIPCNDELKLIEANKAHKLDIDG